MSLKWIKAMVVAAGTAMIGSQADAASLSLDLQYVTTYSDDTFASDLGPKQFDGSQMINPGWVHQFDVRVSVSGLGAGEDLGGVVFRVHGNGLSFLNDTVGGIGRWWTPNDFYGNTLGLSGSTASGTNYLQYDSNGATAGGLRSYWTGTLGNDETNFNGNTITVAVNIGNFEANNRQYGEAVDQFIAGQRHRTGFGDPLGSPTLLGSVFVMWDGTTDTDLEIDYENLTFSWEKLINNNTGTGTASDYIAQSSTSSTGDSFSFTGANTIPEPSTVAALAMTAVALLRRRGR